MFGDYMPSEPQLLDGIPVTTVVNEAWWRHPEMESELHLLQLINGRMVLLAGGLILKGSGNTDRERERVRHREGERHQHVVSHVLDPPS